MTAFETFARSGYAARGVVYTIVGGFAVAAASGSGESRGTDAAVPTLLAQPFGKVLVALLIVGLFGYAAWRACQAILDTDDHGRSAKGLVVRAGLLVGGIVYIGLALSALAVAFGIGSSGGGEGGGGTEEGLMATAIGFFGATWTAAGLAAIFLGVAIGHGIKAWRASFLRFFNVPPDRRRTVGVVGRIGIAARGMVFLILAGMMGYRALTASSSGEPPPSLDEVLAAVRAMPAGWLWLGLFGIGFLAFASYSIAAAQYRTIDRRPLANAMGNDRLRDKSLSPLT